ncbi:Cthe_2314 family HEPN domain-containing protein [Peribacillus simplex]|uniref:Cthe_2314 family HEPN domain-containing protein n=1 Tax=Peribacillus simplex TaxID=1478 RepID=UPI0024C20397|nr:Cthe_2314 family HEPN domain-containing protein [Peribacillus simplex]MDR4928272.1 Cthe_2314 family HEPN domain-containing protein [Peribacillus simplex]WHX92034.1 Cthe_2314 family HEPN domain-containing protein [Peribacillus simplex]
MKKEKEYIQNLLSQLIPFNVFLENVVYSSPKSEYNYLSFLNDIDAWIVKVNSLVNKTNLSISQALIYSESIASYNPFEKSESKDMAYYFVENAIFRISCLWDVYAQICNLVFNTGKKVNHIHYKKYFNPEQNKVKDKELVKIQIRVNEYINEIDEIKDSFVFWGGNHNYVNNLRNRFTHRNDPHIFTMLNSNDGDFVLPDPPVYELKRIIEDYHMCYSFIKDIHQKV